MQRMATSASPGQDGNETFRGRMIRHATMSTQRIAVSLEIVSKDHGTQERVPRSACTIKQA